MAWGEAVPIAIFTSSAVRSPINTLYLRRTYWMIASSILSPPQRIELEVTMPESEITATSVVPPPMSTTMLPVGAVTSRPAPIAAAIGSSIRYTSRAPAERADSRTARFSTLVMAGGTQTTIRGRTSFERLWAR